ncbi:hypothetical protein A5784_29650 [Mycobacterium sp. 852013-50091_SCH5140682]|uniref:hypothetical protein n=1 Tax=Mycobacterium sp. 852013-50091_SCH5140682 TaxID=1834109 RepID=UPI0007E95733|nr:hypothetical protein [Mycobacterium sp. 852013-50091_SCH5140682]OBC14548.1 hypothetical protein A5784_29650 [Mycobacterium sp. 852013-50091_SCH5140682]
MNINRDDLRALVREVVREAVSGLKPAPTPGPVAVPSPPASATPATVADQLGLDPTGPRSVEGKNRVETVRLSKDSDLDAFVRKLLRLFENPKTRADLKAGRLSFRLAGSAAPAGGATHRIDSGAVTERHIADLAGGTLILGRRAVLTPLAREKARSLGITITKERK